MELGAEHAGRRCYAKGPVWWRHFLQVPRQVLSPGGDEKRWVCVGRWGSGVGRFLSCSFCHWV